MQKSLFLDDMIERGDDYRRASEPSAYHSAAIAPGDPAQVLFPDAVTSAIVAVAKPVVAALAKHGPPESPATVPSPVFTLPQAKAMIIAALDAFDPRLAMKAAAIFEAGFDAAADAAKGAEFDWKKMPEDAGAGRWRLMAVEPGQANVMRSVAGNAAAGLNPGNKTPHAIIDFSFDGTIGAVIYLAHEIGHAIADDNLQQRGRFGAADNPSHMAETQAYLVQHIMYGHLMNLKGDDNKPVADAASEQFRRTMADTLLFVPVALGALAARNGVDGAAVIADWLGAEAGSFREVKQTIVAMKRGGPDAEKLLDDKIERLQIRPLGILTALGLYEIARDNPGAVRESIIDNVLSANGPKPIGQILKEAKIDTPAKITAFAAQAVATALPSEDAPQSARHKTPAPPRT